MERESKTQSKYLFNGSGEVLRCTNCSEFPHMSLKWPRASCGCTTVKASELFPDYWEWVKPAGWD